MMVCARGQEGPGAAGGTALRQATEEIDEVLQLLQRRKQGIP